MEELVIEGFTRGAGMCAKGNYRTLGEDAEDGLKECFYCTTAVDFGFEAWMVCRFDEEELTLIYDAATGGMLNSGRRRRVTGCQSCCSALGHRLRGYQD
jgi:hypothetical protein